MLVVDNLLKLSICPPPHFQLCLNILYTGPTLHNLDTHILKEVTIFFCIHVKHVSYNFSCRVGLSTICCCSQLVFYLSLASKEVRNNNRELVHDHKIVENKHI